MSRRRLRWIVALVAAVLVASLLLPRLVRAYWWLRTSNPVRRGMVRAAELGCFSCHGVQGTGQLPNPGARFGEVPAWSGGVWMMYVENDEQIRQYILNGVSDVRRDSPGARQEREAMAIQMPGYAGLLGHRDLEDLVATFKVLSGMRAPPPDSPAAAGLAVARRWDCFSCHGPAGSGGRPNPGSLAGFIPGWYGAAFEDLVRDRQEFDSWVRSGTLPRLRDGFVAGFFLERQRLPMPAYEEMTDARLDELWAYVQWLAATDGGHATPD